ncbi:hypothetical protein EBR96_01225 [bacterium]|nr:hypothetical protein [bacterium]
MTTPSPERWAAAMSTLAPRTDSNPVQTRIYPDLPEAAARPFPVSEESASAVQPCLYPEMPAAAAQSTDETVMPSAPPAEKAESVALATVVAPPVLDSVAVVVPPPHLDSVAGVASAQAADSPPFNCSSKVRALLHDVEGLCAINCRQFENISEIYDQDVMQQARAFAIGVFQEFKATGIPPKFHHSLGPNAFKQVILFLSLSENQDLYVEHIQEMKGHPVIQRIIQDKLNWNHKLAPKTQSENWHHPQALRINAKKLCNMSELDRTCALETLRNPRPFEADMNGAWCCVLNADSVFFEAEVLPLLNRSPQLIASLINYTEQNTNWITGGLNNVPNIARSPMLSESDKFRLYKRICDLTPPSVLEFVKCDEMVRKLYEVESHLSQPGSRIFENLLNIYPNEIVSDPRYQTEDMFRSIIDRKATYPYETGKRYFDALLKQCPDADWIYRISTEAPLAHLESWTPLNAAVTTGLALYSSPALDALKEKSTIFGNPPEKRLEKHVALICASPKDRHAVLGYLAFLRDRDPKECMRIYKGVANLCKKHPQLATALGDQWSTFFLNQEFRIDSIEIGSTVHNISKILTEKSTYDRWKETDHLTLLKDLTSSKKRREELVRLYSMITYSPTPLRGQNIKDRAVRCETAYSELCNAVRIQILSRPALRTKVDAIVGEWHEENGGRFVPFDVRYVDVPPPTDWMPEAAPRIEDAEIAADRGFPTAPPPDWDPRYGEGSAHRAAGGPDFGPSAPPKED